MKSLSPAPPKLILAKTVITRFKRPAAPASLSTSLVTSSIIGGNFAR